MPGANSSDVYMYNYKSAVFINYSCNNAITKLNCNSTPFFFSFIYWNVLDCRHKSENICRHTKIRKSSLYLILWFDAPQIGCLDPDTGQAWVKWEGGRGNNKNKNKLLFQIKKKYLRCQLFQFNFYLIRFRGYTIIIYIIYKYMNNW